MARQIDNLRLLAGALLAVVVPPLCVVCEERLTASERWLCRSCSRSVVTGAEPRSKIIPVGARGSLLVRYALEYTREVSRLIHEMKYGDKPGVAGLLAAFLLLGAEDSISRDAVIVPVPIHPAKRRERGYNQSELLGRHLSRHKGVPMTTGVLRKRRNTASQTALERDARMRNVVGSFHVRDVSKLVSKSVILVDDVVTTGSTLGECALTLLDHGVEDVSACVVASSV